jgi:hypothetical protein
MPVKSMIEAGPEPPEELDGTLGEAFQNMHVMFFLALADGQMTQDVAAQVQGLEMADGVFGVDPVFLALPVFPGAHDRGDR